MPTYKFKCEECDYTTERTMSLLDFDTQKDKQTCPKCLKRFMKLVPQKPGVVAGALNRNNIQA